LGEFSQARPSFSNLGRFFIDTSSQKYWTPFSQKLFFNRTKFGFGHILGDFSRLLGDLSHRNIWSPWTEDNKAVQIDGGMEIYNNRTLITTNMDKMNPVAGS
jgi:hypothetical protein